MQLRERASTAILPNNYPTLRFRIQQLIEQGSVQVNAKSAFLKATLQPGDRIFPKSQRPALDLQPEDI